MSTADEHEVTLRATQARLEKAKPEYDQSVKARKKAVLAARKDDRSIYWIAQVLGVKQNAVRQILGLKRADDNDAEIKEQTQ